MAKAILYENSNYSGYSVQVTLDIPDFTKIHFNDRLTSAKVESGTFTLFQGTHLGKPLVINTFFFLFFIGYQFKTQRCRLAFYIIKSSIFISLVIIICT